MNAMIRHRGKWGRDAVVVTWTRSSRKIVPEVERMVEEQWARAKARLGDKLFDGPLCRLERLEAGAQLRLWVSPTSYKPFLGTNLYHAELADEFGAEVLANPVGLSAAVETCDGWLLLGKRNDTVAYYPNRIHPFAGSVEPAERIDVFGEVLRELDEELHVSEADLSSIYCLGLAEDLKLRQPELVFHVKSVLTRSQLEARLDAGEHSSIHAVQAAGGAVAEAIADERLTPIARATLAMWAHDVDTVGTS